MKLAELKPVEAAYQCLVTSLLSRATVSGGKHLHKNLECL
jgi:hypothetical protein